MASELARLSRVVGKEGKLDAARRRCGDVSGFWARVGRVASTR